MTLTKLASLATVAFVVAACGTMVDDDPDQSRSAEEIAETQQAFTRPLAYRGVNLCGAEFGVDAWGVGALPGKFGTNYTYPDAAYASGYATPDYYLERGMTTFRLPFRWERLQPSRGRAFDAAELGRLKTTVNRLVAKGAAVILDPQNFARYGTALIGSSAVPNSQFADFWSRLAIEFKGSPNVLFGLMNEPHDIRTEQWVGAANAAIASIRTTGAKNLILVPGNGWTGAHSWTSTTSYGTSNATALLGIVDPGNNYAFEVHQYLDSDSSGGGSTCVSSTIGSERMAKFTSWLRANGKRGFLGEFGGTATSTCLAAIDDILKHVEQNSDVYLGWTYWAGGPWWGGYGLSLEPSGTGDRAQMKSMLPHLQWSGTTTPPPSTTCQPTTYEAETMTHGVGGAVSGGWNLWSNGSISTSRTFAAGRTTVTVSAAGQAAGGVWPRMTVSVGGVAIGSASVTTASFAPYAFTFDAVAGTREIRVSFDNDAVVGTADRNLLVDKVVVGCPALACATQTYQAETMAHTAGGAASGGWNLWSNGSASTNATFAGGATTLIVTAAGTSAGGTWPHFIVSVDGTTVGSGSATSTTWRDYSFTFPATVGTKNVKVTFDNDYAAAGEDRNLLLDKVTVRCP